MHVFRRVIFSLPLVFFLFSCSVSRKIHKMAATQLFSDPVFRDAHTGIAVFDVEKNKLIYDYQSDKYFVPASNVKIITLYAGIKFLPDSIVALKYKRTGDTLFVIPTGDPTFLHPDFDHHPAFDFLKKQTGNIVVSAANRKVAAWGKGWMWDDYNEAYMAEKSVFPIYGNVIRWNQVRDSSSIAAMAREEAFIYSEPDINWKVNFSGDTAAKVFSVQRSFDENKFFITQGKELNVQRETPFITHGLQSALELLSDILGKPVDSTTMGITPEGTIYSQPSDSLFRIMMHRSDNFYAEQTLLMAAGQEVNVLDDQQMIRYLLKNDLAGFPQKPRWVDGSGLSRYNLFTPRDFVWVLNKLRTEYGMNKMKHLFPGAGEGTLQQLHWDNGAAIYAKTGSVSGVWCLSGFLYAKSGRLLIFSILVNNHQGSANHIREKAGLFLSQLAGRN